MQEKELGHKPTPAELTADLAKEKGAPNPRASTHSKCHASPSMNMVMKFQNIYSNWH